MKGKMSRIAHFVKMMSRILTNIIKAGTLLWKNKFLSQVLDGCEVMHFSMTYMHRMERL